jgi:hypothetical protein
LDRHLSLKGNDLQRIKSRKTMGTRKKVSNIFPDTPVFLPNGPVFWPKTALLKRHRLQVAAVVRVGNGVNLNPAVDLATKERKDHKERQLASL